MAPEVSFVIINWNGKHLLADCLNSLRKQTFSDVEVLVVDNGSSDGSVELLASEFPEVTCIGFDTNRGFAGPCNAAFRQARGRYIATVNNDVTLDPGWLAPLVAALDRHKDCFAVQGKIVRANDTATVDTCGLGMRPCGAARNLAHNQRADGMSSPRPIFTASAGAALYRKEVLQNLDFFDEEYFAYYEDLDLGWRARARGFTAMFIPEAVAHHKVHGTSASMPGDFLWFLSERNRLRTVVKNMPLRALLRHPASILLDELRYIDMIRKKAKWRTLLRARLAVLWELGSLLRKRSPEVKHMPAAKWDEWISLSGSSNLKSEI